MALLLREAIGGSLRRARVARSRTLRDVAHDARVSLGYLSEVERGRKEASSELLASICTALEFPLPDLLADVAAGIGGNAATPEIVRPVVPLGTRQVELRRAGAPHPVLDVARRAPMPRARAAA